MTAFKDIDLLNATVVYNSVVFGGATADQKGLPPRFSLKMEEVYDSSHRVFKGFKYTLGVQRIFYEDNTAAMAAAQNTIRPLLGKVGAKLEIKGLGTGLDTIIDIAGGPHPLGYPEMRMISEDAWELTWAVEFTINPCLSDSGAVKWTTFNYTTNWKNDFEGRCTRSIAGHYEIVHLRNPVAPNAPLTRADVSREGVQITLPAGFRRVHNEWTESEDHKRMNFAVADEQMAGTPYPVDIIEADGDDSFSTNALTWAEAAVTMSRSYRVHAGKSNVIAGTTFLAEVLAKQQSMQAILPADTAVIPGQFTARNGKFQSSQVSSFSMSFRIVGCPEAFLSAGGLWKRSGVNTFDQWKATVSGLWSNRGNASLTGNNDDDVIIDLCSGTTSTEIGRDVATPPNPNPAGALAFTCPDVPDGGGYMQYDVRLRVNRLDNQTRHRRATTYTPTDPSGDPEGEAATGAALGGPEYDSTASTEHVIEYNGLPTNVVILRFVAQRYKKSPVMPKITTIGGLPATLIKQSQEPAFFIGDLMGCPVFGYRGWRAYEVNGYLASVKAPGSKISCSSQPTKSDY